MENIRTVYSDYINNLPIKVVKQTIISDLLDAKSQLFSAYIQNDDKEFRKVIHMIGNMVRAVEVRMEYLKD